MKTNYSLDDLHLFVMAAQYPSLTQAAQVMDIPIATLSRRLKRLEQQLGSRLLERNAHQFKLTAAGQSYIEQCGPLVADLTRAGDSLNVQHHGMCGRLCVTAPNTMVQNWLGQCLSDFLHQHPNLRLQLKLSNHNLDLVSDRVDLAFRAGIPADSDWVARQVWQTSLHLLATRDYLQQAGSLTHPRQLAQHRLIVSDPINLWHFRHIHNAEDFTFRPHPHISVDDNLVALKLTAANQGICLLPGYQYHQPEQEKLLNCLPDWQGQTRPIYLLYRDRDLISTRLRTLIDFVVHWTEQYQAN
ncbi:LysR family transcriptional regulator [Bowmanella denitrificans]|uniref:LysR family transcriptional regulator n=1 Tax=Bowmanella denitrificans TaxID=366582 RepID=A0ABN0XS72_9ALTE